MKRMGILLLVMALALCLCVTASAEGVVFSVPELTGRPGDDLALTVQVSGNQVGISGCKLDLLCDTGVLIPATDGVDRDLAVEIGSDFVTGNVAGHLEKNCMHVAWWAFGYALPWNGDLLTVHIHVDEGAGPGLYPITLCYETGDVVGNDSQPLPAVCLSGGIRVPGSYSGPGDTNGDGKKDVTDLECLFAYLNSGRNVGGLVQSADFQNAADVNGDKTIDILDYQALYQQLR